MGHGRDTAQEVFNSTQPETPVARTCPAGGKLLPDSNSSVEVTDPFAGIAIVPSVVQRRKVIELQVVVRVDETGQQSVAVEIDDAVAHRRGSAQGDDA